MIFDDLFAPDAHLRALADGMAWTEGPCWWPEKEVFVFSDIPNNRVMTLTEDGELGVLATDVEFTNGRTLDTDGTLIECSHGRRAVQRRFADGRTEVIVSHFGETSLNSPNDVVVQSTGAIWFSDPAYGIEQSHEGHPGEREYGDRWVWRYDGQGLWPAVTDLEAPNGLAFSPDEATLYVTDTSGVLPGDGTRHHIRAYDVVDGRLPKHGRTIIEIDDGFPDGLRVDQNGLIWTSAGDGVRVYTPAGQLVGTLRTPGKVGNLTWGGRDGHTLFICCGSQLLSIRTTVTDARIARAG